MRGIFTFSRFRIAVLAALLFMGIYFGLLLHMIASKEIRAGEDVLVQQTALDAFGKNTSGQIVSMQKYAGRTPTFYLWYKFEAEGRHYTHYSSVPQTDFNQTHIGANARVLYLPTVPEVSRLAESNDRAVAEDKIRFNRLLEGFAWALPLLFALYGILPKRRFRPSPPRHLT